ncbi:MAG: creatininase family protein, partial [Thauera sp.]|nr:creatininase family protein [Thauera sp.]
MNEVEWWRLKAGELNALAARNAVVILPVGSTEQHGPHLPTQVDALLAGEVAHRAARRAAQRTPVVVAPTVWSGLAEHHLSL